MNYKELSRIVYLTSYKNNNNNFYNTSSRSTLKSRMLFIQLGIGTYNSHSHHNSYYILFQFYFKLIINTNQTYRVTQTKGGDIFA